MRSFEVPSAAPPEAAWALLSRPARWPEWAPHLGGAWGLGDPEVHTGAFGAARLLGVVPVPAKIRAKTPGRSWTWQVGPVVMDHRVDPAPGGTSVVAIDLHAPALIEAVVAAAYGPVIVLTLQRLAHKAAEPTAVLAA